MKWYRETHQLKKFGNDKLSKDSVRADMIITREYPGKYYLHIPYMKSEIDLKPKLSAIAIDPGVRSFHNFYDSTGNSGKIATKVSVKLLNMEKNVDKLKSKLTQTKGSINGDNYKINKKRRQNMRKKCAWLRTKIRNIMNDFHWKSASYYCKNYQTIIIPKMDTESLKKRIRKQHKFNPQVKGDNIRKLMTLAHNRCVDRIIFKAKQYGRKVIIHNEAYTSQTCGNCGLLNKELGANTIYSCKNCGKVSDRDTNGARNIMIRALEEYAEEENEVVEI